MLIIKPVKRFKTTIHKDFTLIVNTTKRSNTILLNVVILIVLKINQMETTQSAKMSSTLQEWTNFLNALNAGKGSSETLFKKAQTHERIVMHLEKQFSHVEEPKIFRRLGKHTQLVLRFS
jgi:hypothetical protein